MAMILGNSTNNVVIGNRVVSILSICLFWFKFAKSHAMRASVVYVPTCQRVKLENSDEATRKARSYFNFFKRIF